jgi:DNA-binding transcriptional ArsR family regulator
MQQSLSELLFPGYRRRVLGLLLLHPDEALHGREIARRTGLPAGTLNRELARLADAGLLKRERRGNQLLYSAERACPVFEELASILRKTSGVADVLAAALAPVRERIRAAFVYGSVAGARARAGSDVDLIVIGGLGFGDAVKLLHPAQETLGREISPRVYSVKEWKQKRRAPDAFLRDVLAKPKIFFIGSEHELG